jgi:ATP-binding cassette, subfamily B, bacterial
MQQPLYHILRYIKGYGPKIFLASFYSITSTIFYVIPEIILGFAVDTVINTQHSYLSSYGLKSARSQLIFLGGLTVLAYLLEATFEYLYSIEWKNLAQLIQYKLRIDTYDHVQRLDISFFEEKSSGTILNILVDDINLLENFFNEVANDLLQLFICTIIIALVFLYVSPILMLLVMSPIPIMLFISFYFKTRLNESYRQVREAAGTISAVLSNNLFGITTIKNYTTEEYESDIIKNKSKKYLDNSVKAIYISSLFIPIVRMTILIGYVATLVFGGIYALNGTIPIGAYTTLITLTPNLLWPFTQIAKLIDKYHRAMASANRILNLLFTEKRIKSGDHKLDLAAVKGNIVFDKVTFAYPHEPILFDQLSFNILPGQTVAFVGATGSGKTTITKLLLRYYDPISGIIYLDDQNIKEENLESLRQAFSIVSQDIFLTDDTVENNIKYGSFDASFDRVVKAAKTAEAYDFIMKLPHQFKTHIGQIGQKLSGGQKQRISLARALLKNSPIFIFDEATSAVDNETEKAIHHSLQKVAMKHTTIIIAHRLSTVKKADVIYVLDNGKIVESGTHAELIQQGRLYAHLWGLQINNH